jgi:hypothetical protein
MDSFLMEILFIHHREMHLQELNTIVKQAIIFN